MAMRQLSINSSFLLQHAFFLRSMAYPTGHTYVTPKSSSLSLRFISARRSSNCRVDAECTSGEEEEVAQPVRISPSSTIMYFIKDFGSRGLTRIRTNFRPNKINTQFLTQSACGSSRQKSSQWTGRRGGAEFFR